MAPSHLPLAASEPAFQRLSSTQRPAAQGERERRIRLKPTFIRRPRRLSAAHAHAV